MRHIKPSTALKPEPCTVSNEPPSEETDEGDTDDTTSEGVYSKDRTETKVKSNVDEGSNMCTGYGPNESTRGDSQDESEPETYTPRDTKGPKEQYTFTGENPEPTT